ncbi:unnamed protein product [Strongylus vulgaris]|uniref:Amino acid transporter transmembrane domain-containing protein n=1 Tax=Strongylus vulgaris TaxID=40348 RepID=A0A3P7KVA6_STRVU|nr:unnamed protein product [Strongylus vulgaris]
MIILAIVQLAKDGAEIIPPPAEFHGFGSLFGVTVYAFMCHHSIPSLVTPMSTKSRVFVKILGVYILVLAFYVTLSMTGSFAFEDVKVCSKGSEDIWTQDFHILLWNAVVAHSGEVLGMDVYTLNFLREDFSNVWQIIVHYFLALFPVFVITTNYPIIGCTLINNVRVLRDLILSRTNAKFVDLLYRCLQPNGDTLICLFRVFTEEQTESNKRKRSKSFLLISDIIIYVMVIGFATVISILTDDVLLLTTIIGSYPGVGVQFLVPCLLIVYSRKYVKRLNLDVPYKYSSPFGSIYWVIAIFVWALFAIVMVTLKLIEKQASTPPSWKAKDSISKVAPHKVSGLRCIFSYYSIHVRKFSCNVCSHNKDRMR